MITTRIESTFLRLTRRTCPVRPENRALLADAKEPSSYSIVSLVSGDVLSQMTLPADKFSLATNPRYARLKSGF